MLLLLTGSIERDSATSNHERAVERLCTGDTSSGEGQSGDQSKLAIHVERVWWFWYFDAGLSSCSMFVARDS